MLLRAPNQLPLVNVLNIGFSCIAMPPASAICLSSSSCCRLARRHRRRSDRLQPQDDVCLEWHGQVYQHRGATVLNHSVVCVMCSSTSDQRPTGFNSAHTDDGVRPHTCNMASNRRIRLQQHYVAANDSSQTSTSRSYARNAPDRKLATSPLFCQYASIRINRAATRGPLRRPSPTANFPENIRQ